MMHTLQQNKRIQIEPETGKVFSYSAINPA